MFSECLCNVEFSVPNFQKFRLVSNFPLYRILNFLLSSFPEFDFYNFRFRIFLATESPIFVQKICRRAMDMMSDMDSVSAHAQNGQYSTKQMPERNIRWGTKCCSTCRYPSPIKRDFNYRKFAKIR